MVDIASGKQPIDMKTAKSPVLAIPHSPLLRATETVQ